MKRYQAGDPLPQGHVCRCRSCAPEKLPPITEQTDVREALLDGHYVHGCWPLVQSVSLDGSENLGVLEFQLGVEPWVLAASEPQFHRCKCGDGICLSLLFPREITFEVYDPRQYDEFKARNPSWEMDGQCEDCGHSPVAYTTPRATLCRDCARKRDTDHLWW